MIGEEVIAYYGDAGDGEELFERSKLVRCKDCMFSKVYRNDGSGVEGRFCEAFRLIRMVADDDFCSYGGRKDNE